MHHSRKQNDGVLFAFDGVESKRHKMNHTHLENIVIVLKMRHINDLNGLITNVEHFMKVALNCLSRLKLIISFFFFLKR